MAYTDLATFYQIDTTVDNTKQLIDILTPVHDGGMPKRRKDPLILTLKVNTNNDFVDLYAVTDNLTTPTDDVFYYIYIGTIQTDNLLEVKFDLSDILGTFKTIQFRLIGIVGDFQLAYINLDFIARPEQIVYFKTTLQDLGIISPNKKRIRTWPVTLEVTNDDLAYITPFIDGVPQPPLVVQTDEAVRTFNYQFNEDQFGTDFALVIQSCCPFELYRVHTPSGVQILPTARFLDQVGPDELFRYGKLRKLLVRLIAFGGTAIPYSIYFEDNPNPFTGVLLVTDSQEQLYTIPLPKTIAGTIVRIVLGPTPFEFHRYYFRAQVIRAGKDTENEWVTLQDQWHESGQSRALSGEV